MNENRRKHRRIEWNRDGEVFSVLGKKITTCVVKDISENGARLEIGSSEVLPDCFRLNYGADEQPKCCVRWRKGDERGVEFLLRSSYVREL